MALKSTEKNCVICGSSIPEARLEAIPNCVTCIKCSDSVTPNYVGFMIYPHKTGGEIFMTTDNNEENVRRLKREFDRSR